MIRKVRFAIISNDAFSLLNFRAPLLEDIARRGHQVFALAPGIDAIKREALANIGVEAVEISLSRTGLNPVRDVADLLQLRHVLAGLSLDAVLSFAIKPVIYGTLAAAMAGVPQRYALVAGLGYAFDMRARERLPGASIHYVARLLYTLALSRAEKVFVQNPDDARELQAMGMVKGDQIVRVNGTGVDLSAWPVLPPANKPITFVLAARLLAAKGIVDYVEAAKIIKAKSPEVRFVLLGGVDSNPDAIALAHIKQWAEDKIIEWPGHVDVRPWLAQSGVYVLPSYYREGVPRSIQEAMASGRPVITADTPGCRETVVEGVNGFFVPPRNPVALAEAMQKFIDEPGLVLEMGRQSRRLAEQKFDVRSINAQMIETMGL